MFRTRSPSNVFGFFFSVAAFFTALHSATRSETRQQKISPAPLSQHGAIGAIECTQHANNAYSLAGAFRIVGSSVRPPRNRRIAWLRRSSVRHTSVVRARVCRPPPRCVCVCSDSLASDGAIIRLTAANLRVFFILGMAEQEEERGKERRGAERRAKRRGGARRNNRGTGEDRGGATNNAGRMGSARWRNSRDKIEACEAAPDSPTMRTE